MKKLLIMSLFTALLSVQAVSAQAQTTFVLPYNGDNRWVASEDAADLRNLIKTARKTKATYFNVMLPEADRQASIERLIVLRDILEKNLKSGVVLEEVTGTPEGNAIQVVIKK